MGVPQNPVVVLSFLGAAAAAVGALRRWRRGRGQGIPKDKTSTEVNLVHQMEKPGNLGESQVWTTGQGAYLSAVKGAWDSESSQKVNVVGREEGKDNASPQKGVSDDSTLQEGGEDNVSSGEGGISLAKPDGGEGGQAVNSDGQGSPTKAPKENKIIRGSKVSRAGSPKAGGKNVDATGDAGVPINGPSQRAGIVPGVAGKSGKMQEVARGGVIANQGLDKLDSEAPADDSACDNAYKVSAERQEAASEGDMKPEGATVDRTEKDKKGESAKVPASAEVPDKKRASSSLWGMKRGFLSSGKKTAPKVRKTKAAADLEEGKDDQASGGVEGPVQGKKNAALVAGNAAHAKVPPQDVPAETYSTPKKERYVDTEAGKDRGESPERTPTSVLNAFPNSPESVNGGLPFAGPMRGGASGNAWKRGPIFADRPGGSFEGGLLPLPARSGKVGAGRHTLQSEKEGSGDKCAAGEPVNAKEGVQRSVPEEGKGGRGTAVQERERQEKPREGKQPVGESRQSESGSNTTANVIAGKPLQNLKAPSSQSTNGHSSFDLGSNEASNFPTLTSAAQPPPSDLQGSTTSQIGSHHGEESPEGFQSASEKHRTPQGSPAPASHLPNGSNLAKTGSTDGSDSATKDCPIQTNAAPPVNRLGWANSEQDLDGFDSATESFATPAASAPASPRVNQLGFANPKKEVSVSPPPSKCEIEEAASGPADMVAIAQVDRIQVNGVPSREANGKELEEGKGKAAIAVVAACTWCGHALGGEVGDELALCCMLALQKLQEEAKAKKESGAVAIKSGAAVASSQGVNGGVTVGKGKESGNGVNEGGAVSRQQNGVGGAGTHGKTGADAKAAKLRKVEAAALRAAEGTRWAAKVWAWLEGTSYSDAAR
ncbi:hypothetical protein KFL_006850060 [Klebsormidium nitens]|uniref:Uncharacterized protein n=1 Tax=Klebsormidium nitens TaxID=105231 RepID=A0A1Y1IKW7_KLENI|nr:hypothetical protein KFL_006850060 [Klebsormidium nitens]|eukprot:GAQ90792.1 hypothetical protein KFL_006850060 [Klebsormidium nitens]